MLEGIAIKPHLPFVVFLPGDVDRGFMCDEYARMALAEIKIPPFTKEKFKKVGVENCLQ